MEEKLTKINRDFKDEIRVCASVDKEFTYSEYLADVFAHAKSLSIGQEYDRSFSFINELFIINYTERTFKNLTIKASFQHSAFKMPDIKIEDEITENYEIGIDIPDLIVDNNFFYTFNEPIPSSFDLMLVDEENRVLYKEHYTFTILPLNQPTTAIYKDERLYAKYVTPTDDAVKKITRNAASKAKNKVIKAYQNGINFNNMLNELQAVYLALHEHGIVYQNPPAGVNYAYNDKEELISNPQRIRMPFEVLKDKKATCLDSSILLCSCLEELGYHTILVLIEAHAFIGVFLNGKAKLDSGISFDSNQIYSRATEGNIDLVLIESTFIDSTKNASFQDAIDVANSHLKNYFGSFCAVDINRCHNFDYIYSPVPTKDSNIDINDLIKKAEVRQTKVDSIKSRTYVNVLKAEEKDRFSFWEKKLLDLNESNPLVNIRLKPSSILQLISQTKIYDLLEKKDSLKFMVATAKDNELEEAYINGSTSINSIKFAEDFDSEKAIALGIDKTLRQLIKKSNQAMDETGSPTLYLCCGKLAYMRKKAKQIGYAPFMVLPITITKDKSGPLYTMSYDLDELMLNQSFFEYYVLDDPDIDFSSLYQANASDGYLNIVHTFKEHWGDIIQLHESDFYIANLTFSHYIMWMDVRKRKEELKKNKVIESIIANKNCLDEGEVDDYANINEEEKYTDFAAPLPYDSTQLKAILDCGKGRSFILDGPPGTGKSQTIVNMIVNAFYHGKTVLFVAEKKAALDVVANRLEKIQLGRFCLELHSNKANKGDFFSKLRDSMELGQTVDPTDFEKKCKELEEKKAILQDVINKMHEEKYALSLYDAIVNNEYYSALNYKLNFSNEFLESLTKEKLDEITNLLNEYINSVEGVEDYDSNPLKLLKVNEINYANKDYIVNEFKTFLGIYQDLLKSVDDLIKESNLEIVKSIHSINYFIKLMDLSLNKPLFIDTATEFMNVNNHDVNMQVLNSSLDLLEMESSNSKMINFDKLKDIDANKAITDLETTKGLFKKMGVRKKYLKLFNTFKQNEFKPNKKELITYYKIVEKHNNYLDFIKNNSKELDKLIGVSYVNNYKDAINIKEKYENTYDFMDSLKNIGTYTNQVNASKYFLDLASLKTPSVKLLFNMTQAKFKNYVVKEEELNKTYDVDYKIIEKDNLDLDVFESLLKYAANPNNFKDLLNIAQINKLGLKLDELGLSTLIDDLKANKFSYVDLVDEFILSISNGLIKLYFRDGNINYFNSSQFEGEIKKYKDLINDYTNLIIEHVSAKLTKNLNHNSINYASSSPIGRLKKSISSSGRGVTIRDTLLNYDEIIRAYFPCFLMSPLSAAQYLAVDEKSGKTSSKFDLVIFDEASQIPTHEAVGPIARGKSLIVAGDPEQMPPSAYFSAGLELEGEDIQFEDASSLLDECIAIELPRHRLSFHYRSKHESLIQFSNINFYNSNLFTFPSPNTASSMIDFKYVELKDEKKDSSITKEEVDAILDVFKKVYTDPKTLNKSIGIIVFNIKQQEKVEDAIINLLSKDSSLREVVDKASEKTKEPWFVKSLENVQGDERDIIIISIGFRKSATGTPVINGPLARENGQKRLNVAVSRSKEQMIVVSTIKYSDFASEQKSKSKGPKMLKDFLKFAEESSYSRIDNASTLEKSISYYIKNDLEEKGYDCAVNVGSSIYKVDVAIKSEDKKSYILGILIDTTGIDGKISVRDKLYVQQSVLNGLKWKIVNIYAVEYYKDRQATINKIIDAIDDPYIKETYEIKPTIQKQEQVEVKLESVQYKKASGLGRVAYNNDTGFSQGLPNMIQKIIDVEGPVSFETIKQRVKDYSNIKVFSAKANQRLEYCIKPYPNVSFDQTQKFYWPLKVEQKLSIFRENSGLDIYDICKEEVLACMVQIAKMQGGVSREDLYKLTLQALKTKSQVLNQKTMERMDYVYNFGKDMGIFN
ncbi:MAG: DUF4011 domain-containing protein [Acholeplasmatales bacterium]|nr:DUF4011 domain-containing protein [Acholeplasmatales bacterium]